MRNTREIGRWAAVGLSVLLVSFGLGASAVADYSMPTVESVFQDESLSVIDATVTEFDDSGRAVIVTHGLLLGSFDGDSLDDVRYTCFGGSLKSYGVTSNNRYVFILLGDAMLEETSRFEVKKGPNGGLWVVVGRHYADWLGLEQERVLMEDFQAAILDLEKTHRK